MLADRRRAFALGWASWAVCATWAVCGVGCTGESTFALPTWDAGLPITQYGDACAAWAARVCAYQATCVTELFSQWVDPAQCQAREQVGCELRAADPTVVFDPVAVAGCEYPTDCSAPTPGLCLPPGRSAVGAPCQWDEGCAGGYCAVAGGSTCGTCVVGITCSLPCPASQACVLADDGGASCLVPPSVGQPCLPPDYLCGANGICRIGTSGAVCLATATQGQACSDEVGPLCFDPSVTVFCDETQHCRAVLPASYGQPCTSDDAGDSYECVGWGTCEFAATPVCVPPAADGALCDEQQGLYCLPPARCTGNKCLFPNLSQCSSP